MSDALRIKFGIVCDDVRREDNGKLILIGIYGSNILVSSFPAMLALSLVISVDVLENFEGPILIRALLNGEKIVEGRTNLTMVIGNDALITLPTMPVRIDKAGVLAFQLRMSSDEEWMTIREIPVDPIGATASEPPVSQSPPAA